ncbi:MAG TPA: aldo/keto reductase [Terriglobia bacterium]|jgi:predicted aldo/keto reductase-like oxidoreductase|nr:aldo/keto reductase [Terriglobia bacterium]
MAERHDRREFIKASLAAGVGLGGLVSDALVSQAATGEMPRRPLGKTGEKVSLITLGGAHIGYLQDDQEAIRIMHRAIDEGIDFFDNSWDYNNGRSEVLMGKALGGTRRKKVFLMTKLCSHRGERWSKKECFEILDESLKRLQTDYLDLWQLHEVIKEDHPDKAFASGAAIEALAEAKKAGKVRYIGFTGHRDPKIHLKMLSHDFPFDTVQMPLNVLDAHFKSFQAEVLPKLNARGIGVIAMKPLGGGREVGAVMETKTVTAIEALHYVMNLPVATVVNGIISMERLDQALLAARTFKPMTEVQVSRLLDKTRPVASEGKFENYKQALYLDNRPQMMTA